LPLALEALSTAERYEQGSATLLQLDTKEPGHTTMWAIGSRGDRRRQPQGAGWEFLHVAADDQFARRLRSKLLLDAARSRCARSSAAARLIMLREWAYARPYFRSADRTRVLPGWLEH